MLRTAYVLDERYENHRAVRGHPERPERIAAIRSLLAEYRREGLVRVEPRPATREEILSNHARSLLEEVEATSGKPLFMFDADTQSTAATYETALLAAGGFLALIDAIMAGDADNGFAFVRPPGHHAEADRAMGFCFFNNIAIGARNLIQKHGVERVLIVDWDVHHGNGTQRSFYAQEDVLFISTHQYPFYPGTGATHEVGVAGGLGFTVNIPFPAGFGDDEYIQAFAEIVEPIARQYDPGFVLVSAGFDCHRLDPLGGMRVTERGIRSITRSILEIARDHARGRAAAVLEGGYSLEALREGVAGALDEMGGATGASDDSRGSGADAVLDGVRKAHSRFWTL